MTTTEQMYIDALKDLDEMIEASIQAREKLQKQLDRIRENSAMEKKEKSEE